MILTFLGFIVPGFAMMGRATGAGLDDSWTTATWLGILVAGAAIIVLTWRKCDRIKRGDE
jgi:hypothetical protein